MKMRGTVGACTDSWQGQHIADAMQKDKLRMAALLHHHWFDTRTSRGTDYDSHKSDDEDDSHKSDGEDDSHKSDDEDDSHKSDKENDSHKSDNEDDVKRWWVMTGMWMMQYMMLVLNTMAADDVEGGSLQSQNLCHVVNIFWLSEHYSPRGLKLDMWSHDIV